MKARQCGHMRLLSIRELARVGSAYPIIAFASALLAFRAEMSAALRDQNLPDGGAAAYARLAFAPVGAVAHLKPAALALGVDVIGDGGAAERDGFAENFTNGLVEARGSRGAELRGGGQGMDAGGEEALVGVDVAQAREEFLIEQEGLDAGFTAQARAKIFEADLQGLGAERGLGSEGYAPELARVVVEQDAVVEREDGVGVLAGVTRNEQLPGHAEMDSQGALVQREDDKLASPVHPLNGAPGQARGERTSIARRHEAR